VAGIATSDEEIAEFAAKRRIAETVKWLDIEESQA